MTPPPRRPSPWRRREVRARIRRLPEPPARSVPTLVQPLHNGSSSPHPSRGTPSRPLFRSRAQPSKDRADEILPGQLQHSRRQGWPGHVPLRLRRGRARRRPRPHRRNRRDRHREDSRGERRSRHAHRLGHCQAHVPSAERRVRARQRPTPPSREHLPPAFDHPSTPSYSATACDANVLEARVRRRSRPSRARRPRFESRPRRATEKGAKTRRRRTRTRSRVPPRDATLRRCPASTPCATFANGSRRSSRRVPRNPRPGV